jgi:hypothetical protein
VWPQAVSWIASVWLNPALAKKLNVVSRSVSGAGTPNGPGLVASIRPPRKGIWGPWQFPMEITTDMAIRSATAMSR